MFDHDNFINRPCQAIFGRQIQYIPSNDKIAPFQIRGDFHESYVDISLKVITEADISSSKIVLFVRLIEFPTNYKQALQGDIVVVSDKEYQIVDIEPHIPGSHKLILHEA